MFKLKLALPNLAKGATVHIAGLGELENGKEYIIKEAAHQAFRIAHATAKSGDYNEHGRRKLTQVLGPTLLEAFKNVEGYTVTEVKETTGGEGK
jgi:hypothetical protein